MTPITLEAIRSILGWCAVLNLALLAYLIAMIAFARGFVFRMHSRWYPISEERFLIIHYLGIMCFKAAVFILNVIPFLVLKMML